MDAGQGGQGDHPSNRPRDASRSNGCRRRARRASQGE
jgi:hypothetical protein